MKTFGLNFDIEHFNNVELAAKKVSQLYINAIKEISLIADRLKVDISKPFEFDNHPEIKAQVDKLFSALNNNMKFIIEDACKSEWLNACLKNDALIEYITKSTKFTPDQIKGFQDRRIEALKGFQERKVNGLNLSDRVWKYTYQFKGDLELGLDIGLGEGKSAAELSRDLRNYLQEPQKLFRRVADKRGILRLSQNAKKYQPGAGVYCSSYKNAMRLTRTEVNMAYRNADFERYNDLDFVVGIEVRRSNHVFACPVCESLKGKYPKTFKFVGWHPQCRCHAVSILSTQDEFIKHQKELLEGKETELKSKNEISDVPANFKSWIKDNQERIDNAKSKPFFIKDNPIYLKKLI